ncbi:hypothetical protein COJ01_17000 [Priestia megaterium]|uniref:hypothetical protein n=1 Tax=Priestia megaterium TaxID=1404 RepID=UPI000BF59652|nr:hypothetical protein [Priestia megaterium]PFK99769.1 hypothetical protein COJ01_17000 [Priestia megaterium]
MADNGSTANAVGNSIYPDLILTRFPQTFDERSGSKSNPNLLRQTNLKDYNMAEHVNSLQDAVMAIQRMLGEMAQMPAKPTDAQGNPITDPTALTNLAKTSTVKGRIDAIETHDWYADFDKRYGGDTWTYDENRTTNPTIQEHRHLGGASGIPGMPEKIVLTQEVQGKLPKANVDLSKTATGITGADVYVEPTSSTKISDAINDKISETTGGTISQTAQLKVLGKTNTRWTREFDSLDASTTGNTSVQDGSTLLNKAIESGATAASDLLNVNLSGMYYGRYVAIVRLSASSLAAGAVVELSATNSSTGAVINKVTLNGDDFDTASKYKTFYLIFNHDGQTKLRVRKLSTTASVKVRFDYALVEPVHPAVFDR